MLGAANAIYKYPKSVLKVKFFSWGWPGQEVGVLLVGTQAIWERGGGGMAAGPCCCRGVTLVSACSQVRLHCHGGPGPAPHGLPLPEH